MPTQGLLGFYLNSKWYVIFNEFDSYPRGLGNNILKDVKKAHENNSFSKWRDQVPNLTFIDRTIPPTPEQIAKYSPYTNLRHKTRSTADWDCVLYKAKSLKNCLRAGALMNAVDANGLPKWEQYAYIINFDTNKIDYYYMKGELLESREFNDYDRPFPEVEDVRKAQQQAQGGATAGGSAGGVSGATGANPNVAKFSVSPLVRLFNYLVGSNNTAHSSNQLALTAPLPETARALSLYKANFALPKLRWSRPLTRGLASRGANAGEMRRAVQSLRALAF